MNVKDLQVPDDPTQILPLARFAAYKMLPYYAKAVRKLVPHQVSGLGTWGVTAKGVLVYDMEATMRWAHQDGMAALGGAYLHEAMHWLMSHGERRGDRDPKMWNFAADLWINGVLRAAAVPLPAGVLYPELYTTADGKPFPEGLMAEEYYDLLTQDGAEGPGLGDDDGEGVEMGACGSGAGGEPLDGEPTGGPGDDGPPGRTEMERVATQRAVAEDIRQQHAGNTPAGLERWVEELLGTPQVHWTVQAGRSLRPMLDKLGRGKRTYKRNSRMSGCLGGGSRPVLLPVRSAKRMVVWFVVDTSASMGPDELAMGMTHIDDLCKRPGVEVRVFSCDAALGSKPKPVRTWREAARQLKGGGGTDFRPIFDYFEEVEPGERPDMIAVWTDGCGPAPERKPAGLAKALWCLVDSWGEAHTPATWGDVVTIRKDAA